MAALYDYRSSVISARKYKITVAIIFATLFNIQLSSAQEENAYRTVASGNFHNPAIWQRYAAGLWIPATEKPTRGNDIYIENPHRVTMTQNEEVNSVYLNADAGAEQKLIINGNEIEVFGSLNAYSGSAPGIPRGSFLATDWIGNSINSRLVFKGGSRVIISAGAWSAQNTNSRYTVIFDPDDDAELIVERPFKANQFVFRNGTVVQRIMEGGECSTFSFNTNFTQFPGIYGNLVIEAGGTLISECNNHISLRAVNSNTPSALFDVREGGRLILRGNQPQIHAADVRFDGTVVYGGSSGNQQFLTSNLAMVQRQYRNLHFEHMANKIMPPNLTVMGDFIRAPSSGQVVDNSTDLTISGPFDQMIIDPDLHPTHITVNKSGGIVSFHQDLRIKQHFQMLQGSMDFLGQSLYFPTAAGGTYTYTSGRWLNLNQVNYLNTPESLNEINASFPFNDDAVSGIRKLSLIGNSGHQGYPLVLKYVQIPGVNWNPDFSDHDHTPILYKTNSYFEVVTAPISASPLEMIIDADELIVLDPIHLRVVGNEGPAPGEHLDGVESGNQFLARRTLSFSALIDQTFAIGSVGLPSVLPAEWLQLDARIVHEGIVLSWLEENEDPDATFKIRRSFDDYVSFHEIDEGHFHSIFDDKMRIMFLDKSHLKTGWIYYQVEKLRSDGSSNKSPVVKVFWKQEKKGIFILNPIPYVSGPLDFRLIENIKLGQGFIRVYDNRGSVLISFEGELNNVEDALTFKLQQLPPGLYMVGVFTATERQLMKWIRK
ncbi:hypothetical protein [Anditalea andensis]|uniref:Secretion system C-terminal sorting domain-containing protein n=1 Tax=Anditalea andensis TaxID=1048983 RepID=A0A074KWW4_9BACT|nr:hypothetical protein [Anditalea andensis]KEO72083.1 hypothetical protein EL17_19420 [Anditalea andensis]